MHLSRIRSAEASVFVDDLPCVCGVFTENTAQAMRLNAVLLASTFTETRSIYVTTYTTAFTYFMDETFFEAAVRLVLTSCASGVR